MKKFEVYLVRYASVIVDAENEGEAMDKVAELDSSVIELNTEADWNIDYAEEVYE